MLVHGILNVNKPEDRTSFSIIGQLRRLSRVKQIGHTGTLDPFASGVLPVCFGQACKISRFISGANKAYTAVIELGTTTDTFDRDGTVTSKKELENITTAMVEKALDSFRGNIEQIPPAYSAIKIGGRKSYSIARSGSEVLHKPRSITITSIEPVHFKFPLVTIKVECSKGTYIRSLANDLGQLLGCGAYLKELTRTRCGVFTVENAMSIEKLEEAFKKDKWQQLLQPLDFALSGWDKIELDDNSLKALLDGNGIDLDRQPLKPGEFIRAYNTAGRMTAILKYDETHQDWRHEKFFQY